MVQAAEIGAIIFPPAPAFYLMPETVSQLVDNIAVRAINLMALKNLVVPLPEWRGKTHK